MTHPVCAYNCIALLTTENPCQEDTKCLCTNQSYLTGFHNCINEYCDAADISEWIALGKAGCSAVGVVFTSTSAPTATPAPGSAVTSVIYQTSTATAAAGGFPVATSFGSTASTDVPQPASSPTKQDSKSGLGVGAIVGIAVGGVIAVLLVAGLVAFLLWRRKRKQHPTLPPEPTPVRDLGMTNSGPNGADDLKPMPTSNVIFTPELSGAQAMYAASYEKQPFIPKVSEDYIQHPLQQLAPIPPNSTHQLSPSTMKSELVGAVPSEVEASTRALSEYAPPYPGYVEADSTHQHHITSPVSELESAPYPGQYEMSTSPQLTHYSIGNSQSAYTARELSSSPVVQRAFPTVESHISAATGGGAAEHIDGNAGDSELDRMRSEVEATRLEIERVLHLQALHERERELSRKIVDRELSRGGGS